jgi:hypothetical protein
MAREFCEILITEEDETGQIIQTVAGAFVLDNNKLTVQAPTPEGSQMLRGLMNVPAYVTRVGDVTAQEQPALWFHRLPRTFSGTYLSAQMVT